MLVVVVAVVVELVGLLQLITSRQLLVGCSRVAVQHCSPVAGRLDNSLMAGRSLKDLQQVVSPSASGTDMAIGLPRSLLGYPVRGCF